MKKLGRILSSLFVVATIWAVGVSPGAQAASPNLIANPSVETASADPALPQSWQRGG